MLRLILGYCNAFRVRTLRNKKVEIVMKHMPLLGRTTFSSWTPVYLQMRNLFGTSE